ncbi:unnamed protein product [Blumeria hordei]|uniref:Protein transport protein sec16 n=1 Tax=Blumeria hordei TaxID=2867405 RepID=A0A383UPW8_BLUHO|nr:unnamed protein product [Blumeria hordei]
MSFEISDGHWNPAFRPNSNKDRPNLTHVSPTSQALQQEPKTLTELQQQDNDVKTPEILRTTAIDSHSVKRVQEITLEHESTSCQIKLKYKNNEDITRVEQCSGSGIVSKPNHQIHNEEGYKEENTDPIRSPTKHNSTLSFARTVSEEVTWTDDEVDHDWNLQRTDAPYGIREKSDLIGSYSQALTELEVHSHTTNNIQAIREVNEDDEQNFGFSCIETSLQNRGNDSNADTPLSQYQKGDIMKLFQEDKDLGQKIATKDVPVNLSAQQPRDLDFLTNYEADDSNFFELVGNLGMTVNNQISIQSNLESTSQTADPVFFKPNDTKTFENESNHEYAQKNLEKTNGTLGSTTTMDPLSFLQEPNEMDTTKLGDIENCEPASMDEDLVAKWKAAFSDDQADDFLETDQLLSDSEDLNKNQKDQNEVDPAALFGSDDEGFLEDLQENPSCVFVQPTNLPDQKSVTIPSAVGINSVARREDSIYSGRSSSNYSLHAPISTEIVDPLSKSSYIPQNPHYASISDTPKTSAVISSFPPKSAITIPPPPKSTRPDMPKAKSFAKMSKGGYSSPYDLPLEFLPKKRGNLQQISSGIPPQAIVPPPRNSSLYSQPPSVPIIPPEGIPQPQTSSNVQSEERSKNPRGDFFKDLPPANTSLTTRSPGPYTPDLTSTFNNPQMISQSKPDPYKMSPAEAQQSPGISQGSFIHQGLVQPERVGPYSSILALNPSTPPPLVHSQTAPIQVHHQIRTKPELHAGIQKYVPSLKTPLSSTTNIYSYEAQYSSPQASFQNSQDTELTETSHVQLTSYDHNQTPFMHEPVIAPLSKSEESIEYESMQPNQKKSNQPRIQERSVTLDYKNLPPSSSMSQFQSSPSKNYYSNFTRQNNSGSPEFAPPQRSRTQSPRSTVLGSYHKLATSEKLKRPASVKPVPSESRSFSGRQNNYQNDAIFSQVMAGVTPQKAGQNDQITDQSIDPLKIRKGSVIFAWGSGGTIVTSFPRAMPRYTVNEIAPIMMRSSGEIKIQNIKTMELLGPLHAKFPGPLKGKAKKKEILAWLSSGIDLLQLNVSSSQTALLSIEDKRLKERILLWQILRIFIEQDGILDGKSNVEKAVSEVLSSGLENENGLDTNLYTNGVDLIGNPNSLIKAYPESSIVRTESVDIATIDEMKKFLLHGEREKAIWEAVDKRLWAHALLMANSVSRDLYKQVAQEFIQKEVKEIGENTQSLAALYEIFAGNFEESIDELVAPSARAGFQMVSTVKGTEPSKDALNGLDRWRETLILVLNNRSAEDHRALISLGNLLAGYGRVEAAHICFFFAKSHATFGGIDDPQTNIVLVGSDHLRQPYEFDRDLESILLSEVFEYGNSLVGSTPTLASNPHLTVYKLQHAKVLAENGLHEKALQYCENIASSITSQTRRSPYHHNLLLSELDDLSTRLKQSPKDDSGSWISKPSIDKAKGSVWATFNKFVAGEDTSTLESPSNPSTTIEAGIFARMARETPTISRTTSSSEIPGHLHGNISSPIHSTSRYAPSNNYISEFKEPNSASSYGSQPGRSVEIEYEKEKLLDTPVNDKSSEKTRAEKDRETDEAFRRAAEADEKRSKDSAPAKKGWGLAGGFTGWFGGGSKKVQDSNVPNKPIRAKLGEASSFVYDTELKRWVNKKAGAEETDTKRPMPPPPRATQSPRPGNKPLPPTRSASATASNVKTGPSVGSEKPEDKITSTASPNTSGSGVAGNIEALRIVSNGSFKPPSRPSTGMSNASSIDDLLGPPTLGRKAGLKAKKKGRGYVDVMSEKAL